MSIECACVYWSDGMCKKFSDGEVTSFCVEGPCSYQMPSNADHIRAMRDDELCNWLFQRDCTNIAAFLEYGGMGVMNAVQLLEWLQQPAE